MAEGTGLAAAVSPIRSRQEEPSDSSIVSSEPRRSERLAKALGAVAEESARRYQTRSRRTETAFEASLKRMHESADNASKILDSNTNLIQDKVKGILGSMQKVFESYTDSTNGQFSALDTRLRDLRETAEETNRAASGVLEDFQQTRAKIKSDAGRLEFTLYLAASAVVVAWIALVAMALMMRGSPQGVPSEAYLIFMVASAAIGLAVGSFVTIYRHFG